MQNKCIKHGFKGVQRILGYPESYLAESFLSAPLFSYFYLVAKKFTWSAKKR